MLTLGRLTVPAASHRVAFMQFGSHFLSVSVNLHEISWLCACGEEGQTGGGRTLCPDWKPREAFIMHIFIGACVTQTNPLGKGINERTAPGTG